MTLLLVPRYAVRHREIIHRSYQGRKTCMFKELSMDTLNSKSQIDLNELARLAGFPVELVKKELFSETLDSNEMSLQDLRDAMMRYLDSTMLN